MHGHLVGRVVGRGRLKGIKAASPASWVGRWAPLGHMCLAFPQEKEDKAHLQAEVQHLREDNLRLQEESQNASDKLKKFTEWVFNTIDMS